MGYRDSFRAIEEALDARDRNGLPLMERIRVGDRVTIRTPHGRDIAGRAVMPSAVGGWVLDMGGQHGTPGLCSKENVRLVKRKGKVIFQVLEKEAANGAI